MGLFGSSKKSKSKDDGLTGMPVAQAQQVTPPDPGQTAEAASKIAAIQKGKAARFEANQRAEEQKQQKAAASKIAAVSQPGLEPAPLAPAEP